MPSIKQLKGTQRKARVLALRVDGTGTAAILEGSIDATLVDNGTGDYTLTWAEAFSRMPVIVAQSLTADSVIQVVPTSGTSVQILGFDATDGTTAKDIDFHLIAHGWDTADAF